MKTVEKEKINSKRKTSATSVRPLIVRASKTSKNIPVKKHKPVIKLKTYENDDWLQKSNLLFKHNPACMALINLPDNIFIDANESSLKTFGFTRKEVIGKTSDELNIFVQPQKRKEVADQLQVQGYIGNIELQVRRKDGTILDGLFSGEIIEHHGKKHFLIVMIDMTSRKLSEKAQRESEEKYRTILENIQEGYFEVDLAGNFTFFSDSVCQIHGYSKEKLMGMNNRQYMDKETAKKVFQTLNKVYRTGEPLKYFDWQIIRKDGSKRFIEASVSLKEDSSGKPVGFRGLLRDITERKETEELLRKSEEQYRLLADHIKDQVWLMDLDLKVTYVSPSAEKLLGYTLQELIKLPLDKLLTPTSIKTARDFYSTELSKALAAPPTYSLQRLLELEFICKDGRTYWSECAFSFIRNEKGNPVSILGEGRNITE
ncbi:MAG: PAS domain-containing protein, partial [Deltaproteobacteria bacterium]|nr:PAS domain-containing protein [Deltaproteobacteria bacterium]